jgi:hypothetical protein
LDLVHIGGKGLLEVPDHGLLETRGGVNGHEPDEGLLEELERHASPHPTTLKCLRVAMPSQP